MDKGKSGSIRLLLEYACALLPHWVAVMSGIASIALSVWEKYYNQTSTLGVFLWLGLLLIFYATFLAWRDKSRQLSETEGRLVRVQAEFEKFRADKSQKLRDQYWKEFEQMKVTRKKAASYFMGYSNDSGPAEDLLDFFDARPGQSVRDESMSLEQAYDDFYYFVQNYWFASPKLFEKFTADDRTVWENLAWLWDEFGKLQKKKTLCTDADLVPKPESVDKFLREEGAERSNSVI